MQVVIVSIYSKSRRPPRDFLPVIDLVVVVAVIIVAAVAAASAPRLLALVVFDSPILALFVVLDLASRVFPPPVVDNAVEDGGEEEY